MALRRRRLALALGAGGTRGFAHLGVIKALLDAGLPIDAISGASAGALFGALFAMDGTLGGVSRAMSVVPREIWGLFRDRLRIAPSNPLGARLTAHFAGARLESLPVAMTVLAVDLHSGDEIVLREGNLRAAVEASIAIPLLARPVALEGRYLIDGGFGRKGPSAAARTMGDVVIFVSLGEVTLFTPRLRPLAQRFAGRLRQPLRSGPPTRRTILRRAVLAMAADAYDAPDADLVLAPPLGDINPNSPFAAESAYRRGERSARQALPAIRRLLSAGASS